MLLDNVKSKHIEMPKVQSTTRTQPKTTSQSTRRRANRSSTHTLASSISQSQGHRDQRINALSADAEKTNDTAMNWKRHEPHIRTQTRSWSVCSNKQTAFSTVKEWWTMMVESTTTLRVPREQWQSAKPVAPTPISTGYDEKGLTLISTDIHTRIWFDSAATVEKVG